MTTPTLDDLRRSFATRAVAYAHFFDVLRERFGVETALNIGMEATHRMGVAMAPNFARYAPADLSGLKQAFLDGMGSAEALFAPELQRCDDGELRLHLHRCPLKEAWQAMGRGDEDVALLCRMAGAIDRGVFEGAGFTFAGETWHPGGEGCCLLRIHPGRPAQDPGT